MEPAIAIRAERPDDGPVIAGVVRRAYADVPYSDHREHRMVDRLRRTDAYLPALSLLAEVAGEAVGHVLLTRAHVRGARSAAETLALAPLSVVPEFQGRGVGRRLVEAAHAQAVALGFRTVVLVGPPGYYARFGYEPLRRYPVTLPFDAPDENCMIAALVPHAADGLAGRVEYAPGWLDH